jgi:hypothetical protein
VYEWLGEPRVLMVKEQDENPPVEA